nr:MAG TPA: hypothetical protein [Caudoviricetes sp.]
MNASLDSDIFSISYHFRTFLHQKRNFLHFFIAYIEMFYIFAT